MAAIFPSVWTELCIALSSHKTCSNTSHTFRKFAVMIADSTTGNDIQSDLKSQIRYIDTHLPGQDRLLELNHRHN
jgi:hypothetical protein